MEVVQVILDRTDEKILRILEQFNVYAHGNRPIHATFDEAKEVVTLRCGDIHHELHLGRLSPLSYEDLEELVNDVCRRMVA